MSWRDQARPIIAHVLRDTAGLPEPDIRTALREAYPWGPRSHHPYKIWCDETARQRRTGKYASKSGQGPLFERIAERIAEIEAHNRGVGDG